MDDDRRWMALALTVARRAAPAPNPRVGAVVIQKGRFVSVGWHERAGEAHAEVRALAAAQAEARGSTLYVTLEPCNHHGRTPPCVDAILAAQVRRVVIGCPDPNPQVPGGGIGRLRLHLVEVSVGVRVREARKLIEEWHMLVAARGRRRPGRPYTADGEP
ncbi:MAG: bifunctional diaminohydroxyphosphoribosylaminopyrimidine deaminase/5-amino-6-(5-phosphoribosylamino)uracil reductase RibD [Polyangiaceae bacterium]